MRVFASSIIGCATIVVATMGQAASPEIQTPSPVIHLADNLDEADSLGWCIDTIGRGLSDQLHAHSCKPRGGDVQFSFDSATGQIRSVAFDDLCAQYDGSLPLALVECANLPAQFFVYEAQEMTFRPAIDPDDCLVVGASSRSAGPYMSRDLGIASCDDTDALYKTWVIKP